MGVRAIAVPTSSDSIGNAQLVPGARKTYRFVYDFAVQGGTTGAKTLTALDGQIPANFTVDSVLSLPITSLTSGGAATLTLGITGDADAFTEGLGAPVAFDSADVFVASTTGYASREVLVERQCVKVGGSAVDATATIAGAALTAGKFELRVSGWEVPV